MFLFYTENVGEEYQIGNNIAQFWDLHMSYRRLHTDHWIPLSYINSNMKMFTLKGKPFSQRSDNISIFVSNGTPRNSRNKVYRFCTHHI